MFSIFPTLFQVNVDWFETLGKNPNFVNEIFRKTVLAFYFSAK